MSEFKPVSPLLDGFTIGTPVNDHFGICCYPAVNTDTNRKYILKVIALPASQSQADALLYTGAFKNASQISEYFHSAAQEIEKEVESLRKLSRQSFFLPFEGCQIEPMEHNLIGHQVFLLSCFRLSLEKYMHRKTITHLEAVNLGIDLCAALTACRKLDMVYVALKPSNIFITSKKEYKIGDLGLVPMSAMRYTPMPAKYRSVYTPPELMDDLQLLNPTVDTYAVGMILYQLFNDGVLPVDTKKELTAPMNADDDITAIIRKACSVNPDERWQSPEEMSQALVHYIQTQTVNATPIMDPIQAEPSEDGKVIGFDTAVFATASADAPGESSPEAVTPPAAEAPEVPAELLNAARKKHRRKKKHTPEQEPAAKEPEVPAEEASDAETAPEPAEEVPQPQPEETEQVPAEPDSVPVPEAEKPAEDESSPDVSIEAAAAEEFAVINGDSPEDKITEEHLDSALAELHQILHKEEPAAKEARQHPNIQPVVIDHEKRKKSPVKFLMVLLLLCLLAAGGFWGYMFYQTEYLTSIDALEITGSLDQIVVTLQTDAPDNLLRVTCTDTYGHSISARVRNGKAIFQDLSPDTMYKVLVEVNGVHKLVGITSEIFTTESVTNVVSFTVTAGHLDGSANLNLVVEGHEPSQWQVLYTAEGEPELGHTFSGHATQINNLVLGKRYTFRLETARHESVNGQTVAELTASRIVIPRDVTLVSCTGGELVLRWIPVGEALDGWSVSCIGEGYSQTQTVDICEAVFSGIDEAKEYTVEVRANGMSEYEQIYVSANPIAITDLTVDSSNPQELLLSWAYEGTAPEGWVVQYTLDSSDLPSAMRSATASVAIGPKIPGAIYHFTILTASGTTVLGGNQTYQCPPADRFTGFGLGANSVNTLLLPTPENPEWRHSTVPSNAFTNSFSVGQSISMVLNTRSTFYLDDAPIHVVYVFRDQNGNALAELISEDDLSWRDLWAPDDYHSAELDLPVSPFRPGSYTLDVYFNSMLIASAPVNFY